MKKVILPIALCLSLMASASAPQTITYQAVVRNNVHKLVRSKAVGVRISILKGSEKGSAVYSETRRAITNPDGLLTFAIGDEEAVSKDDISKINWEEGPYFIKCEMDPDGGTNYTLASTSQLLSVPYAIYAERISPDATPKWTQTPEKPVYNYSEIVGAPEIGDVEEKDPAFKQSVAAGITKKDTARWNKKLSSFKETDPKFSASVAATITQKDIDNWNKKQDSNSESDPLFQKSVAAGISKSDTISWNKAANMPASTITNADIEKWNSKLNAYSESDPEFAKSVASTITQKDINNWNSKPESFSETDPEFNKSVAAGITAKDTARWNNTDRLAKLEQLPANGITNDDIANWNSKPDNYTETDPEFVKSVAAGITAGDTARWNKLQNSVSNTITKDQIELWNNKLDSYSETDPFFRSSVASGITTTDTARWNKLEQLPAKGITHDDIANWNGKLTEESDPAFAQSVAAGISAADTARWNKLGTSVAISQITETDINNWNGKLGSYTEADPEFAQSVAAGITTADTARWNKVLKTLDLPVNNITADDIANWNAKLAEEADPAFTKSIAAGITATDTARWNKARQLAEKLAADFAGNTGVSEESDPVFTQSVASAVTIADTVRWNKFDRSAASTITSDDIENWNNKLSEESEPAFKQSVAAGISENDTARWNKFDRSAAAYITEGDIEYWNDMLNQIPTNISFFENDEGYINQKDLNYNNNMMYYMMLQMEKYYEDSLKAVAKVRIRAYVDSVVAAENNKLEAYKETVSEQINSIGASVENLPSSTITTDDINNWNNKLDKEQLPEWAQTDTKPVYNYSEIADVPTKVSAFENDAQYITKAEFDSYKDSIGEVVKGLKEETEELRRLVNGLLARETKQRYLLDLEAYDGGNVVGRGYYTVDSMVTVKAIPNEGYEFVKWDDGVTTAEREIKVDREGLHFFATFKKIQYQVSLSTNTSKGGYVTGAGKYDYMSDAKITASPYIGYKFIKWSDENTQKSRTIKVDGTIKLTAIFEKN